MMKAHEVYEKWRRGDSLTDKEVEYGRRHFRDAASPLYRQRIDGSRSRLLQLPAWVQQMINVEALLKQ